MKITLIGIALAVAGIGIFAFTLIRLISGSALDPQTKVPGTVSSAIPQAGRYYLWDNHWTTFAGTRWKYPADCPTDAQIVVRDSNGDELEFIHDTSQNWSIGNNEKTSIGYTDISSATTVQFEVDGIKRERIVSVSDRTMKQELWSRLSGLGLGVVIGLVGGFVALVGLLRGSRASVSPHSS